MALMTSSVETGENALGEKPGYTWLKVGDGALLVLSLTSSSSSSSSHHLFAHMSYHAVT